MVNLFGPIIDISKIPVFSELSEIQSFRYLDKFDVTEMLRQNCPREYGWKITDVTDCIAEALKDSKVRMQLVDREILTVLCRAKNSQMTVKIISGFTTKHLFESARTLVIEYSKYLCNSVYVNSKNAFVDGDFELLNEGETIKEYIENLAASPKPYRIVFDDGTNLKMLCDEPALVDEWVSGMSDKNCLKKLTDAVDYGQRIANINDAIQTLVKCRGSGSKKQQCIKLSDFSVMNHFCVYDEDQRKNLSNEIEYIKKVVSCDVDDDKPVCVFLAGAPGTGKSYFVKLLREYLDINVNFCETSLSGVTSDNFTEAITKHIEVVYDEKRRAKSGLQLAFLDEVDTDAGVLAFRLLMNAMTGTFTGKFGDTGSAKTKKLVWIFAGSACLTREEFIAEFRGADKKVLDFFDRIHFDLKLPTVDNPGQAILTFLSSLQQLATKDKKRSVSISNDVLHLFGRTAWKSARQITTICRVAYSVGTLDTENITLKDFAGISALPEFNKAYGKTKVSDASGLVKIYFTSVKKSGK